MWPRLADYLRGLPVVVLLHDATPFARYPAGQELLHALINSARRPDVKPHGLWLVCPMEVPSHPAQLDDHLVGAVDAQGEQVTLTRDFVTWNGI